MKIYSHTLTTADLYETLPRNMRIQEIEEIENPRTRDAVGARFERGWVVYCSGSSSRAAQRGFGNYSGYNAATWDEYGIWFAALYELDEDARISWYKTYEDFLRWTKHMRDFYANENSVNANQHRAPWLSESEAA